jgi:hypothetical protein
MPEDPNSSRWLNDFNKPARELLDVALSEYRTRRNTILVLVKPKTSAPSLVARHLSSAQKDLAPSAAKGCPRKRRFRSFESSFPKQNREAHAVRTAAISTS